ncbi:MAG: hypothetical protein KUG52_02520 [Immundisolibacteraceae bacterium]|nr:hypothetical protein [Immundisolibacteraceae bacterium]
MKRDTVKLGRYRCLSWLWLAGAIVVVGGCSGNPLPSSQAAVHSKWDSFAEAKQAFDAIDLGKTTTEALDDIGYGLNSSPNVRILNYLELTGRFMPNPAIGFEQLDEQVRRCLKAKTACEGYLVNVRKINKVREGSVMLDLLNIKRRTRSTGWQFDALLLINKNLVVYKIWGGTPNINEQSNSNNPLGPLQKLPSAVVGQVF